MESTVQGDRDELDRLLTRRILNDPSDSVLETPLVPFQWPLFNVPMSTMANKFEKKARDKERRRTSMPFRQT